MITLINAIDRAMIEDARTLFREYQQGLGIDLCFQNFETELRNLPGDYAPPRGRLLLAMDGDMAAGCIAMRPLTDEICEMKRLYVRPHYRATGLGRQLAERIITEARSAGYRWIYLDTLPIMERAQRLYEQLGFSDIAPYTHNPIAGVRYLGLALRNYPVDSIPPNTA
jgi:GNAT superfamily N-acetyltransferase